MTTNSPLHPEPELSFAFCGGGSGGHLYPAIAVCEELEGRFPGRCQFLFLTSGKKIESVVLADQNAQSVKITSVTSSELKRRPVRSLITLLHSIRKSRTELKKSKPCVVIGSGGYGSLPGIIAGWSLKIPILLMEQNIVPGRANTFLSRFARTICTSFPDTAAFFSSKKKCIETGNPVRKSIRLTAKSNEISGAPTLLIVGGSQGAAAINLAMAAIIEKHPELLAGWHVIHQTGAEENAEFSEAYENARISAVVSPFLNDMPSVLNGSTLAISRAGATTLAELAIAGLPAILVPYPNSVRDHQELNARFFSNLGAAEVVMQSTSQIDFEEALLNTLQQLLSAPEKLVTMSTAMRNLARPEAAKAVADEIVSLGNCESHFARRR